MTEESKENRTIIETTVAKVKSLLLEGNLKEAVALYESLTPFKKDIKSEDLDSIKEVLHQFREKVLQLSIDEIIAKGYTPENMQALTDTYDKIKDPHEKREIINKMQENPESKPFAVGLIMHEYEKELSNYMKKSISEPANDTQITQQDILAKGLNETREIMHQMGGLPEIKPQPKPKRETSKPKPRSQTAEMGTPKKEKKSFFTRIKDRLEQFKLDYHYSGIVGALGYREKKGDGTFLRKRFDKIDEDFSHIKKLDLNRYPNMPTQMMDFTKIDHVILPNPKENPIINLSGSKLKGKVDLSAYDKVILEQTDLSKVTELDLSGCKHIDLRGVDLSKVKVKFPEPLTSELYLDGTKLPKMDNLDLSKAQKVNMNNTDLSQVNTVVMPQNVIGSQISGWPKHIDASECQSFIVRNSDMSNVEKITPPATSHKGPTATKFELSNCSLPKVENLDVSNCGNVWMTNNDMPSLKNLKIRGGNHLTEYLHDNNVANLKNIEVAKGYIQPPEQYNNMFQTYKNISQAVELNRTAYKDAETGKLCPLTENQKKAIEVINSSAKSKGDGLDGFWETMSSYCNDPKMISTSANLSHNSTSQQQKVLTEYNKALSQALGLKSYINMETLKYEKTPPLKEGEMVEIPPFNQTQYNKLAKDKSTDFDKWGRPQAQTTQGNTPQTRTKVSER